MSPPNDLASMEADPEWLPFRYDWQRSLLGFAWIPRVAHSQLTFLADDYVRPLDPPSGAASIADVRSASSSLDCAPHYIFHSAFACSTLIARALDAPGASMALNEPQVINHLAVAALQKRLSEEDMGTVVRLLGRPFASGEAVIVKPSNEANFLAHPLMGVDEKSRAIFLYAPLPRFLASVAKKGMWGRIWSRRVFATLRAQANVALGLSEAELFQLSDLQVAALTWLLHNAQGAALIAAFPDRVRTLDSDTFLANRARTLDAVGAHFGIALDGEEIAAGPAFATHSKEIGRSVDPEAPLEPRIPMPTIDEEIEMVSSWAQSMAGHLGIAFELPRQSALLGP